MKESVFLEPLKSHIKDIIKNQFHLQQSKIIRLTAVSITELVKKQYITTYYDKYNDVVYEYPDSFHIRKYLRELGYEEVFSNGPFGYCTWESPNVFFQEEKKKGYIFKAEDWFEPKEIKIIFRNSN